MFASFLFLFANFNSTSFSVSGMGWFLVSGSKGRVKLPSMAAQPKVTGAAHHASLACHEQKYDK